MNYHVKHITRYRYARNVLTGYNRLSLTPRNTPNQKCLSSTIEVAPVKGQFNQQVTDYFGNQVHFFSVEEPHKALEITATSEVSVTPALQPPADSSPLWETVREELRNARDAETVQALEYVFPSPQVPISETAERYALESFTPGRTIIEAGAELTRRIYEGFEYDPTATTVATPVSEVFENRRGVCQDFAHLQIACLRSIGLAARYVSGYIAPKSNDDGHEMVGAYASHAWLSIYTTGHGWVDLDPTNNVIPTSEHITIGWAREYADISPVRGIVLGGGNQILGVSVDIQRS